MSKIKFVLLFIIVSVSHVSLLGQGNSTSSPYSRYGYGILADQSSSVGYAMGGLGYGLRKSTNINPMNPASYSAVDSLTFLFDMGVDFQFVNLKENGNKQSGHNGNIKNINMLFPVGKGLAFSAGILPVSYVGYDYGISYNPQHSLAQINYSGKGGFHQVYGGIAYKYNDFSIGANIGYLFGNLEYYTTAYPDGGTAGVVRDSIIIRSHDLIYSLGVQQIVPMNEDMRLVLGAVYTPKLKMTARGTQTQWVGSTSIKNEITPANSYEMAQSLGIGASVVKGEKLTIGADVLWENWAAAKVNDATDTLNNRLKYTVGTEFVPDARSRNLFKRMQYRLGGYYSNSYITTNAGSEYNEFGLRLGFGIPVINKSVVHISFDYTKLTPTITNALSEDYFKITLNYTFNEIWFRKRRLH